MDIDAEWNCLESMMREWEAEDVDIPRWEKGAACAQQELEWELVDPSAYLRVPPPPPGPETPSPTWVLASAHQQLQQPQQQHCGELRQLLPGCTSGTVPAPPSGPQDGPPPAPPPHIPAALLPSVSELASLCTPSMSARADQPAGQRGQSNSMQQQQQQQQHHHPQLPDPGVDSRNGARGAGQYVVGCRAPFVVYSPSKAAQEAVGEAMGMARTAPVYAADPELPALRYISLDSTDADAPRADYTLEVMGDRLQSAALEAAYMVSSTCLAEQQGADSSKCMALYTTVVFPAEQQHLGGGTEGVRVRSFYDAARGRLTYSLLDIFSKMAFANLSQAIRGLTEALPAEMRARLTTSKWGKQGGHPAIFGDIHVVRCALGMAGLRCKKSKEPRTVLRDQEVVDAITRAVDGGRLWQP